MWLGRWEGLEGVGRGRGKIGKGVSGSYILYNVINFLTNWKILLTLLEKWFNPTWPVIAQENPCKNLVCNYVHINKLINTFNRKSNVEQK